MCIKYTYIKKKFTIVLGLESRVVTALLSLSSVLFSFLIVTKRMKERNSLCSRVTGREGSLLLILLLRPRKGAASAGSLTVAEEGYGCEGGYSWASGLARSWLLLVLAMVQQRWCC
jgi:hypothetical protein